MQIEKQLGQILELLKPKRARATLKESGSYWYYHCGNKDCPTPNNSLGTVSGSYIDRAKSYCGYCGIKVDFEDVEKKHEELKSVGNIQSERSKDLKISYLEGKNEKLTEKLKVYKDKEKQGRQKKKIWKSVLKN